MAPVPGKESLVTVGSGGLFSAACSSQPATRRRFGSCPQKTGVATIRGALGRLQSEAAFCVQGTLPSRAAAGSGRAQRSSGELAAVLEGDGRRAPTFQSLSFTKSPVPGGVFVWGRKIFSKGTLNFGLCDLGLAS